MSHITRGRLGVVAFFVVATTLGVIAALPARVALAAFSTYGRAMYQSYYTGDQTAPPPTVAYRYVFESTTDIPYEGISQDWATDQNFGAATFISEMQKRLNSPTDVNSSRAAAIINMMMGVDGDSSSYDNPTSNQRWQNGVTLAKNNFAAWSALVNSYDTAGRVDWNTAVNSAPGNNDHDWLGRPYVGTPNPYPDITPIVLRGPTVNDAAIIFKAADGSPLFIMKKKCANLSETVGPLTPIVTPPPTPTPPTPTPTPPTPPPTPAPTPTPFLQAKGGDVVAGAGVAYGAANACGTAGQPTPLTTAGIVGWNSGDPNYDGAGAQYAAFAMGQVQAFASNQGNGNTANAEPSGLTFANTVGLSASDGLFGGMFGSAPCVDYWSAKPASALDLAAAPSTAIDVSTLSGTIYANSGNVTLYGTLGAGQHLTIYVDGDVAISDNISYGSYSSIDQIPAFKLIVHGSIFIDKDVTQLDGLYVAIPDAGAESSSSYDAPHPGTISTCSSGFASYDPTKIMTNSMFADCNKRLVVTGSVVAQQLWALRTLAAANGTIAGQPAEEFDYSPEMWLAQNSDSTSGAASTSYQSIIGLPPVL